MPKKTDPEPEKTPVELAEERLAEATAALASAQVEHDTSHTAQALTEAKAAHAEAVAAHADVTTQKVEPDKHILVRFGGTNDAVIADIPEGAFVDGQGRCRERRLLVQGKNVEHVSEVGDVWVYAEM